MSSSSRWNNLTHLSEAGVNVMHKEQQNYRTFIANFYNILNPYFELQHDSADSRYCCDRHLSPLGKKPWDV